MREGLQIIWLGLKTVIAFVYASLFINFVFLGPLYVFCFVKYSGLNVKVAYGICAFWAVVILYIIGKTKSKLKTSSIRSKW